LKLNRETIVRQILSRFVIGAALAFPAALALADAAAPDQSQPAPQQTDQEQMLRADNPTLAANKRLVYDFYREVLEGGHVELADQYLTESYIQHNPNVPTGRAGFVSYFSRFAHPAPIAPRIKAPLIAIVAESNFVVLTFVHPAGDPKSATGRYTTTWFDMFRIENGRIAEHWDPALKDVANGTGTF